MAIPDPVGPAEIDFVKQNSDPNSKNDVLGAGGQEASANYEEHQLNNPILPDGTSQPYQNINLNNDELLKVSTGYETSGGMGTAATGGDAAQSTASQADTRLASDYAASGTASHANTTNAGLTLGQAADHNAAHTYDASQAGIAQADTFQMNPYGGDVNAQTGDVDPRSTMEYQFDQLMSSHKDASGTPDWARTAVTAANQRMAALGLGASTIAGGASTAAILNAALPMAATNSAIYSDINKLNISNRQQAAIATAGNRLQAGMANLSAATNTAIANMQSKQSAMLENARMDNAAKQYNAQSEQQNDQFRESLLTNMSLANASMANAVAQFNAGEANKTSQFNAAEDTQTSQFNATQANQMAEFNAAQANDVSKFNAGLSTQNSQVNAQAINNMRQYNADQMNKAQQFYDNLRNQQQQFNIDNQRIVNQSNVQWRRTINTANTAGANAAAQTDAANRFNMSQTALNNLWQQTRDEASWSLTASENQKNRVLSLVNSSLNRQTSLEILNSQMQSQLFSSLGGLATNVIGGAFKSFGSNSSDTSSSTGGFDNFNGDAFTATTDFS